MPGQRTNRDTGYGTTSSFHVYLNPEETGVENDDGDSYSRDAINYIDEESKKRRAFATESDLSWGILRRVLANTKLT
ncbi:hypothetical protein AB0G64_29260 [Streptomyces longwoodensis]|uniref:hypothetical protein n=1 Tax=Streptomyces longwoodensis TaxID=68231 RepID=UPI00341097B4